MKELESILDNISVDTEIKLQPFCSKEQIADITTELIKNRVNHCISELKKHLPEAKAINDSKEVIAWEGGHFSVPVYKYMKEFLENPTFDNINIMIAEQALRQLADEPYYPQRKVAIYFLSEFMIVKATAAEWKDGLSKPSGLVRKNKK
jgi:hypothetical protein